MTYSRKHPSGPATATATIDLDDAHRAVDSQLDREASRRRVLRNAALVAGGAVAGVAALSSNPAGAANGQPLLVGTITNSATSFTRTDSTNTAKAAQFMFQAGTTWDNYSVSYPSALAGLTTQDQQPTGVYGYAGVDGGNGVVGVGNGVGVLGHGAAGYSVVATTAGKAVLLLAPSNPNPTPPAARQDAHIAGEIDIDANHDVWLCTGAGSPGVWRKISGPSAAGAFHALTPGRVYDSRLANPGPASPIHSGQNRTISVADRRDLAKGAAVQVDFVPAGATAIAANVTVVNTADAGFLAVNPGGNTIVSAATINWFGSGQILNNGVTLTLDGLRKLTIIAGGGGSTDVIIDVTGYYL